MNQRGCIRTELPAHREQKPSFIARARKQAFGVYQPLTDQSAVHVRDILTGAKVDIDDFLAKRRRVAARVTIPKELGVTFVMKGSVDRQMRFGSLMRSFDLGRMLESVESHAPDKVVLPVPIGAFDWFGQGERKLVAAFAASDALEELRTKADIVEELLHEAGAADLFVRRPDHISLYKYGRSRDNLDLSRRHKSEVADIVAEHFDAAGIEYINLGRLVMGNSYNQPMQLTE